MTTDLFGRRPYQRRHLKPVPTPRPAGSLEFALAAVSHHALEGDHQAMLTALADALWLQHLGRHEHIDDHRMLVLIRRFAGIEWTPASLDDGGEAA